MEQLQLPHIPVSRGLLNLLLAEDEPSIQYYTLLALQGRDAGDSRVQKARDSIGKKGWAAQILAKQKENTYWYHRTSCYSPKFSSCVWQLLVLADLGVTAEDPRVKSCLDHLFDLHNVDGGGFAVAYRNPSLFEAHVCMTGNMVSLLARMGCAGDDRVGKALDWLLGQQLEDGGWNCSAREGGKHGSFHATIEPLWGLSHMLAAKGPNERWQDAAEKASEFLLRHRLYRSDRDGTVILLDFLKLHYPIHYRYDILHALRVLTEFGIVDDSRMNDAVGQLLEKRLPDGSWPLEAVYRGWRLPYGFHGGVRTYRPEELELITRGWGGEYTQQLEEAGKPSKWLTLQSLLVLKRVGALGPDEIG